MVELAALAAKARNYAVVPLHAAREEGLVRASFELVDDRSGARHHVELWLTEGGALLKWTCSCPCFARHRFCKHVALAYAAFLKRRGILPC